MRNAIVGLSLLMAVGVSGIGHAQQATRSIGNRQGGRLERGASQPRPPNAARVNNRIDNRLNGRLDTRLDDVTDAAEASVRRQTSIEGDAPTSSGTAPSRFTYEPAPAARTSSRPSQLREDMPR